MSDEKKGLAKVQLKRQAVAVTQPFSSTEGELRRLSEEHGSQALDLARVRIPLSLLSLLPRETAELHSLVPIRLSGDSLLVAMAQPNNKRVIDELSFVTGKNVVPYVAPLVDLEAVISAAYMRIRSGDRYYDGPGYVASAAEASETEDTAEEFAPRVGAPAPTLNVEGPDSVLAAPGFASPPASEPSLIPESRSAPKPSSAGARPDSQIAIPDLEFNDAPPAAGPPDLPSHSEPLDFTDDDVVGSGGLPLTLQDEPAPTSSARAAQDEGPRSVAVNAGPIAHAGTNAPHVLVVEDEPDIQRLVRRLLESEGLRVSLAADGEAALSALKSAQPDLLVLDAMLPKIHGFEIVRRVRASRRFSKLPIIILTAVHRGWCYAEDLRVSGVRHYLEKPFESRQLLAAVNECLGGEPRPVISPAAAQHLRQGIDAYTAGDLDAAQSHFEQGMAADPAAYQVHFQLGLLHGKRGKEFDAIGALEQAVRLRPRYFVGIKNLALLYQKAGFRNKSAEMWQRALGLAPDENTKESIRQHLGRLV